jgi:predicted RND superfamily exporter protein
VPAHGYVFILKEETMPTETGLFYRYARFITTYRYAVILALLAVTVFLGSRIGMLKIDSDPDLWAPQAHPYVQTTNALEKIFGGRNVTIIGITPKNGDIYQPHVLAKIATIQRGIEAMPQAIRHNVVSLAARKVKSIKSSEDGMEVRSMMDKVPQTPAEIEELKQAVARMPVYINSLVSPDGKTAAIIADFKTDKKKPSFTAMLAELRPLVESQRDDSVEIHIGGLPTHGHWLEHHMKKMPIYFGAALLIILAIQYLSFRSLQGMLLPFATSILSVIWALGIMGMIGVHMDPINSTTPILVMALAAGHAIQILKRYYEEYKRCLAVTPDNPREASRQAVRVSLARVAPAMLTAGLIAVITFFSLSATGIIMVQHFGVFAGCGVLGALILELSLIPAVRASLAPPRLRETEREQATSLLDRLLLWIARQLTGGKAHWFVGFAVALLVVAAAGLPRLQVDNRVKERHKIGSEYRVGNGALNERLAGTNSLIFLIETPAQDGIKDPKVMTAISHLQAFLDQQPHVGKTQSLVDLVKSMNRAMHADKPEAYSVPESRDLITQYLFLYSLSGEPQDFDSLVDNDYRKATVWTYLKNDSSAYADELYHKAQEVIAREFPPGVTVRMGGSLPQNMALNEVVTSDKFRNMAQMAAIVFVLSAIAFRSLVAGLFVVLPLLGVILANFGLMGWFGIPIDISSSTSAAMAIGIGADYEIYLLYRFREELRRTASIQSATVQSLLTSGKAILFVAMSVIGGYSVLQFSAFTFYSTLSTMVITTMVISAGFALFLLRALMVMFKPDFIFAKPVPLVSTTGEQPC